MFIGSNLSYRYKKQAFAISDVDLQLDTGSSLALMGHNGAGKTTLLKLVLGLLTPSAGSIDSHYASCAYVPEHGGFYPSLTVAENIKFRMRLARTDQSTSTEIMNALGLERYSESYASELSQGFQKRLAIACALVTEPSLFVLDEPTNGLDPITNDTIGSVLSSIRDRGTALLISSHDLPFIAATCNEGMFLENGKVAWCGKISNDPTILKEQYFDLIG